MSITRNWVFNDEAAQLARRANGGYKGGMIEKERRSHEGWW